MIEVIKTERKKKKNEKKEFYIHLDNNGNYAQYGMVIRRFINNARNSIFIYYHNAFFIDFERNMENASRRI